jgi:hypothetical protein
MLKFKGSVVCVVLTMVISLLMPVWIAAPARAVGPGDVDTGLLLWLDASDPDNDGDDGNNPANESTATSWLDKSGQGNDANILSGQDAPIYVTQSNINNIPAFRFRGLGYTVPQSGPNGPDYDPNCDFVDNDPFTEGCQWEQWFDGQEVFEVPEVDIRASVRPDVTIFSVYRATTPPAQVNWWDPPTPLLGVWGQDNGAWDRFFIAAGFQGAQNGVVGLGPTETGYRIDGAGNQTTRLVTTVYDGNMSGGVNTGALNASQVYFDGALVEEFTDSTHATDASANFRVGFDGNDSWFDGDIAEIIIYDRILSAAELSDVTDYLADKYGIVTAPTTTTNAATSIGDTTATLNATVNANGADTTALTLRYSTSADSVAEGISPSVTPSSVTGSTDTTVSALLTGLSPGTTYFFRVLATNSSGTNFGETLSFTTADPPASDSVVNSCEGAGAIQNGSFEQTSTVAHLFSPTPTGWGTTARATRDSSNNNVPGDPPPASAVKAIIELTSSNTGAASGVTAFAGSRLVEIAADGNGGSTQGIYQDVNTLVGSRVFWSYRHHRRISDGDATQISRFRAAATPSGTPAGNVWTLTEQNSPFGSSPTLLADHYDTVTASGWANPSGTFEATTSSTRFLFGNVGNAGSGNLIDDVRFTTYSACPITVRIVAGRTSNFVVRNVEQDTSAIQVFGSTFRYYAPASAEISTLSEVSTGLTASVANAANTSSTFTLSASEVGTYSANYRISYVFNGITYTSTSTLTVEVVPEVSARFPRVIPFDPTLTTKQFPGIRFATATNVYACFDQSNSGGSALATPTITIGQGTLVNNVAEVSTGPPLIDSGTVGGLTAQSSRIRITANSGVLGRGGSKYLRVRASSTDNTDGVAPSCANGISFVIEFRTIKSIQTRRFVVPLKNGRQSS